MSAAVYHEPYKLPAGILAVAVHGAFFVLLYFGFAWQAQPAGTMSVELWQSLPTVADAPFAPPGAVKAEPPPPEKVIKEEAPPPPPEKIIEPEIVLPDKKKEEVKPVEAKQEKKKPAPRPEKKAKSVQQEREERLAAQAARESAERAAAAGRMVDEYTGKIVSKIRRNIVMPPDVPDDARAEFMVTLLPGGTVLNARLDKSSGNAAYDNAVERAILKSQPLPLPVDAAMFNRFRKLRLVFRPVE